MGTGKPNGRPSGYTLEIADMICEAIAHGHGLHQMCRDNDNWPSSSMVYRWLDQREEFREAYARARQRQADYLAEEIKDISDNSTDWNKARLQVDTRKWIAARLAPRKYGDRLLHSDADLGPLRLVCEWKKPGEGETGQNSSG